MMRSSEERKKKEKTKEDMSSAKTDWIISVSYKSIVVLSFSQQTHFVRHTKRKEKMLNRGWTKKSQEKTDYRKEKKRKTQEINWKGCICEKEKYLYKPLIWFFSRKENVHWSSFVWCSSWNLGMLDFANTVLETYMQMKKKEKEKMAASLDLYVSQSDAFFSFVI